METYPLTIHKTPTTVAGARVLAWAEVQHISGNYPGGIVLAYQEHGYPEYVTWVVYTHDGGETWQAFSGHYIPDHDKAWNDFVSRCTNLTER